MITWIIEPNIYSDNDSRLIEAAKTHGQEIVHWNDEWISSHRFPSLFDMFSVFHGSLNVAAQINNLTNWKPGAFCTTQNYFCSVWYPRCQNWLLHKNWATTTVSKFVGSPELIFEQIEATTSVFVRPDSPLKPFSGRVIHKDNVTLKSLDFGFYYEDENLPIIVAPVRVIDREWRFIVIQKQVVAGSAYIADNRNEADCVTSGKEWEFAQSLASLIPSPDNAYTLDICETEGNYKLLEINPFSGADLYACDRNAIVKSISRLAGQVT